MAAPITLLVSKDDRALTASSLIAGERARVDIDDPFIQEAIVKERRRVIDITSVSGSDPLGHDRYASPARFGAQLADFEPRSGSNAGDIGAFVFDAAGTVVASPFRLLGRVTASR